MGRSCTNKMQQAPPRGRVSAVYKHEDESLQIVWKLVLFFIFLHKLFGPERGNMCDSPDSGNDWNGQYGEEILRRNVVPYHGYGKKANYWLVTYLHSQVEDKTEFHRLLRNSIECYIPWSKGNKQATIGIFGCKQVVEGVVRYRVVIQFSSAQDAFTVYIDDRKQVADTSCISICRKRPYEPQDLWLEEVQNYLAKSGDAFGAWIHPLPTCRRRPIKPRGTKTKRLAKRK